MTTTATTTLRVTGTDPDNGQARTFPELHTFTGALRLQDALTRRGWTGIVVEILTPACVDAGNRYCDGSDTCKCGGCHRTR